MSSIIMRTENLSLKERKELEIKCSNRLNWTDGGNWMGRGKAPNCMVKERIKSKSSHTLLFPTDLSANKWNSEWEKTIRHGGYIASALLGLATGFIATATASFSVSVLSGIVLGETQASIEYPKMERDWSYEVIFEYDFSWSPHPFSGRTLTQTITGVSKNHLGQQVKLNKNIQKYELNQLPDGLGRLLASSPPKITTSVYS
ncbi:hypothetical protein PspMM1_16360 [Pseudoalteromonas sp. MM1]|uniref:hypothetical protein n=1 Tax=Pseudoalteromonas sp. MM1 TaxID=3036714 RepID=UPI00257414A9|nr:hypothetical protein [Pseudoalteromonas sp. MM1]BED89168.1 hypothetical protein PspMM1_16360 [Pseudoalteromonas sp. MM1]